MDAPVAWDTDLWGWNTESDNQGIPDVLIGIIRQRWSSRHEHSFFAVRSFTTDKKDEEMEILKEYKATGKLSENIAIEIGNALQKTFNTLSGFVVTSAPKHKTGFACLIAQCTADFLKLNYKELFFTVQDANAKRNIWGIRPEITIREIPPSILWIDDTLTTGQTLSTCRALCLQSIFIPIVWIYDDVKQVVAW